MAEPTSSTAAGVVGWKLIGGVAGVTGLAAALATTVVMCMTPPRTKPEWVVALISTIMCSIGGGAFVVQYFGLQAWVFTLTGALALFGLVFACGLPGWAIVRWLFNYLAKREGRGLDEVIQEVRGGFASPPRAP